MSAEPESCVTHGCYGYDYYALQANHSSEAQCNADRTYQLSGDGYIECYYDGGKCAIWATPCVFNGTKWEFTIHFCCNSG